jgi:hypothetical protein
MLCMSKKVPDRLVDESPVSENDCLRKLIGQDFSAKDFLT